MQEISANNQTNNQSSNNYYLSNVGFLDELFGDTKDAVFILDSDCRIIKANQSVEKVYGYRIQELLGKTIFELRQDGKSCPLHSDSSIFNPSEDLILSKHLRKDGTDFPVEVFIRFSYVNGKCVGLCMIRDISEFTKIRSGLQDQEQRFKTLFNKVSDAIFLWEIGEDLFPVKMLEVNEAACKRFGYERDELLQLKIEDLVGKPPEDLLRDHQKYRNMFLTKDETVFESVYKTKYGEIFPVEIHYHRFMFDGRMVALTVVRDVSKRMREPKLLVHSHDRIHLIDIQDIVMISRLQRKSLIYTKVNTIETYEALHKLQERINHPQFFRCHKSYLINTKLVNQMVLWGNKQYQVLMNHISDTAMITADNLKEFKRLYCC